MKIGIAWSTAYHGTDARQMAAVAEHAEACGVESLYLPEHVALYPGVQLPEARRGWHAADPRRRVEHGRRLAGRDALAYTRWGAIDIDADDVADLAAQGVTRVVVAPGATDLDEQRTELIALARRLRLG